MEDPRAITDRGGHDEVHEGTGGPGREDSCQNVARAGSSLADSDRSKLNVGGV